MITFKPKNTKFKHHMKRLRHIRGKPSANIKFLFDSSVAIMADKGYWIRDKQLETIRLYIVRKLNALKIKKFDLIFRVFPHRTMAKRKPQIPMGGGKSDIFCYVAEVKRGMHLFELSCDNIEAMKSVIKGVSYIIPNKHKILYNIKKEV